MPHNSEKSASLLFSPVVFAYQQFTRFTRWLRRAAAAAVGFTATAVTFMYATADRYPEIKPARNALSQFVVTVLEKVNAHTGIEIPVDAFKSSLKTQ